MPDLRTQSERIASLETLVGGLTSDVKDLTAKIDSLLELKNKGMGAFWLVSVIMGAVFTGFMSFITDWLK